MKRNLLIFTLLFIALSANAQKKWYTSFVLGPQINKYNHDGSYYDYRPKASDKVGIGLTAGVDFYRIYETNMFFKTGIRYMQKHVTGTMGVSYYNSDSIAYYDYDYKVSYINAPLVIGYKFQIKNQQFYVSGGLELNYEFHYSLYSSTYGSAKQYTNGSIYNLTAKFVLGAAYLYKLNDNFSLMFNPVYANSRLFDEIGIGDYLHEWQFNFGVIFNLP